MRKTEIKYNYKRKGVLCIKTIGNWHGRSHELHSLGRQQDRFSQKMLQTFIFFNVCTICASLPIYEVLPRPVAQEHVAKRCQDKHGPETAPTEYHERSWARLFKTNDVVS